MLTPIPEGASAAQVVRAVNALIASHNALCAYYFIQHGGVMEDSTDLLARTFNEAGDLRRLWDLHNPLNPDLEVPHAAPEAANENLEA